MSKVQQDIQAFKRHKRYPRKLPALKFEYGPYDKFRSRTDEQAQVIEFAKKMNLDYGEFDVLRDLDDKKIYIVDVNNTPFGPPSNISGSEGKKAISILAKAFREAFLSS